ncbi:hypothetical protein Vau01_074750 [Virgisporangium aurantiacum]|uniref:Uridine kinase n=1 Tax=Virgisporangium aurantiacum TaxID=175570 RepID=A0A8J3Z9C2_9ACTN|nr:uridine kinase [Virgisporangium aurantiacum]GIJ59959.1 hypothetical protein Vau01_074750 [Virgisporangium aurantiacum]
MHFRPIAPVALAETLADDLAERRPSGYLSVAIDGPPPARPDRLAASLVDPLRARGRAALAVATSGFLRPASVRFERGRTDPDAFYESWFDLPALVREVLDPLPTGRVLPDLWDPVTDRATRSTYVELPPRGVLLLHGPLLLGAGLAVDYSVHLLMTPAALKRRTDAADRWTLPAYERYAAEVGPADWADVVVRSDDPDHPAISMIGAGRS